MEILAGMLFIHDDFHKKRQSLEEALPLCLQPKTRNSAIIYP